MQYQYYNINAHSIDTATSTHTVSTLQRQRIQYQHCRVNVYRINIDLFQLPVHIFTQSSQQTFLHTGKQLISSLVVHSTEDWVRNVESGCARSGHVTTTTEAAGTAVHRQCICEMEAGEQSSDRR